MQRLGEIEVEGERGKGPSKAFRAHFGHTPLSAEETIPWHSKRLYVGTGKYRTLPIMSKVYAAAEEKGIEVVARPTPSAVGTALYPSQTAIRLAATPNTQLLMMPSRTSPISNVS